MTYSTRGRRVLLLLLHLLSVSHLADSLSGGVTPTVAAVGATLQTGAVVAVGNYICVLSTSSDKALYPSSCGAIAGSPLGQIEITADGTGGVTPSCSGALAAGASLNLLWRDGTQTRISTVECAASTSLPVGAPVASRLAVAAPVLPPTAPRRVFYADLLPFGASTACHGSVALFVQNSATLLVQGLSRGAADGDWQSCGGGGAAVIWGSSCEPHPQRGVDEPSGLTSEPWWWDPLYESPAAPGVGNRSQGTSSPWTPYWRNASGGAARGWSGRVDIDIDLARGDAGSTGGVGTDNANLAAAAFTATVVAKGWADHVAGKPFVVVDAGHRRVACGIIYEKSPAALDRMYHAELRPIASTVASELSPHTTLAHGSVTVLEMAGGTLYGALNLVQLESSVSVRAGFHIHAGVACDAPPPSFAYSAATATAYFAGPKLAQGGHLFESRVTDAATWGQPGAARYVSDAVGTTLAGFALRGIVIAPRAGEGLATHLTLVEGKPFVVHDSAGKRVACGVLRCMRAGACPHAPSEEAARIARERAANRTFSTAGWIALLLLLVSCVCIALWFVAYFFFRPRFEAWRKSRRAEVARGDTRTRSETERLASLGMVAHTRSTHAVPQQHQRGKDKEGGSRPTLEMRGMGGRGAGSFEHRETLNPVAAAVEGGAGRESAAVAAAEAAAARSTEVGELRLRPPSFFLPSSLNPGARRLLSPISEVGGSDAGTATSPFVNLEGRPVARGGTAVKATPLPPRSSAAFEL